MIPSDWLWGLIGGLAIGAAAALYLLANGRIMGASGILGALLRRPDGQDWAERAAFVAGLVLLPAAAALATHAPATHATDDLVTLVAGGLLVGYGTRLGHGCTSGHGVCGLSRLSSRGIAATATFLGAGILATALLRHVLGAI